MIIQNRETKLAASIPYINGYVDLDSGEEVLDLSIDESAALIAAIAANMASGVDYEFDRANAVSASVYGCPSSGAFMDARAENGELEYLSLNGLAASIAKLAELLAVASREI